MPRFIRLVLRIRNVHHHGLTIYNSKTPIHLRITNMASTTAPVRRQGSTFLTTTLRQPRAPALSPSRAITTATKPLRPSQQYRQPLSPQCLRLRRPFSTSLSRSAVSGGNPKQRTSVRIALRGTSSSTYLHVPALLTAFSGPLHRHRVGARSLLPV